MSSKDIVAVVLSGGSGTRLWPLSRQEFPKQFAALAGAQSLFEQTLGRISAISGLQRTICISNKMHRSHVTEVLERSGAQVQVILEPVARNTAPALCCSALVAHQTNPESTLVCLPADHIIQDPHAFVKAIDHAVLEAAHGRIWMTLGVVPTSPASAYGYMLPGEKMTHAGSAARVRQFVEKPERALAESLISEGALWNSGVFVVRADELIASMAKHAPDILSSCQAAVSQARRDAATISLDEEAFSACKSQSIDYAVLEKHSRVGMVPLEAGWTDAGVWNALSSIMPKDELGNRLDGDAKAVACRGVYVRSPHKLTVTLGVEDIAVIDTPDALLVAANSKLESVGLVVQELQAKERSEVVHHRKVVKPWGSFDTLDRGETHQVKRLTVNPGSALSLQVHKHRSEHWTVVRGCARVTVGDEVLDLQENGTTFVPQGTIHRLENPAGTVLEVIEVQYGSYLEEDDIERLEDRYGRAGNSD